MRIAFILYFIFVLAAFSCTEDRIDKKLLIEDTDLIIVEATITNEKLNHKITISRPFQQLNGDSAPVSGAIVFLIEGNGIVYSATEMPPGSGEYYTEEMTAVFGKVYTLYINYLGKEFYAQSASVPVQPMEPLNYFRVIDEQYELQLNESGSDPYYIDHNINWKNTASCLSGNSCEGRIVYYDLKIIDVNERFKADKEKFRFPAGARVIRKKYSVNPGYKSYLRSVLSETEWRGGVFDVQRANPKSNLSEGATGYFAVSTVLSDTTIIVEKP